jgi:plasmid stabilization system protein ParE
MEVVWSAKARVTYFSVLEYLEKNWSKTEIIRFSRRTESVIQAIQKNPGLFV